MPHTYLTYSREPGDFNPDLAELKMKGLSGIRLINKGLSATAMLLRIQELLEYIRAKKLDLHLLIDLPGEKPMIGKLTEHLDIQQGAVYSLCCQKQSLAPHEIPTVNFLDREDLNNIKAGDIVSIADGELEMSILGVLRDEVTCRALNTFQLRSDRSFNIRGNKLPARALSQKDLMLAEAMKHIDGNGLVSLLVSFTTEAAQLQRLNALCPAFPALAKIEDIMDMHQLDELIKASDGVMLGRGDLTAANPMSAVFAFQRLVIERCKESGKQLIVATGLFGELKSSGKPSISDIMDFGYLRNAGVDAFLIAGSNAAQHPFETLQLITHFDEL